MSSQYSCRPPTHPCRVVWCAVFVVCNHTINWYPCTSTTHPCRAGLFSVCPYPVSYQYPISILSGCVPVPSILSVSYQYPIRLCACTQYPLGNPRSLPPLLDTAGRSRALCACFSPINIPAHPPPSTLQNMGNRSLFNFSISIPAYLPAGRSRALCASLPRRGPDCHRRAGWYRACLVCPCLPAAPATTTSTPRGGDG
jgi:hypothetical protein